MLREYTGEVICRDLVRLCALFSGLCALLCPAAIRFRRPGAAAVLGSCTARGCAPGPVISGIRHSGKTEGSTPSISLGKGNLSVCSSFRPAKGRDLSYPGAKSHKQAAIPGAAPAIMLPP